MARIKDINGDGKRNFKDTWLGEKLLGGGKTKGPNLKESMAGARRESSAAPMKSAAPAAKPSTKATTSKTSQNPAAKPKPVTKDAMSGYRKGDITTSTLPKAGTKPAKQMPSRIVSPTPDKTSTGAYDKYSAARMGNYTKAEYDAMSISERAKKGLPMSWVDRTRSGGSFKLEAPTIAGKGRSRNTGKGIGMAKGGMVSKKGKC